MVSSTAFSGLGTGAAEPVLLANKAPRATMHESLLKAVIFSYGGEVQVSVGSWQLMGVDCFPTLFPTFEAWDVCVLAKTTHLYENLY